MLGIILKTPKTKQKPRKSFILSQNILFILKENIFQVVLHIMSIVLDGETFISKLIQPKEHEAP